MPSKLDPYPTDLESERFILGSILTFEESLHACRKVIEPDSFTHDRHRKIWAAVCAQYDAGLTVDIPGVALRMRKDRVYTGDDVGYMSNLTEGVPAVGIEQYVAAVQEKLSLRRLMQFAENIRDRCVTGEKSQAIIEEFGQRLLGLAKRDTGQGLRSAAEIVAQYGIVRLLQPRHERGLMTPWPWLNSATHGLLPAELWVLAAHTSNGKTSAMIQFATHLARRGKGVAVFSLEVGDISLFQKASCQMAGINADRMKAGKLDGPEKKLLDEATTELHDLPIYFDTTSNTVMAMHSEIRHRLAHRDQIDLVIGDYLQLFANSGRSETRAQAVGANAWGCKMMATDFGCPFLLLSQFSRPPKQKPGDAPIEPSLFDLKESGDVENHANGVWFIHRETMEDLDVVPVQFILPKQRDGRRNIRKQMQFVSNTQTFHEPTREEYYG